TRPNLPRLAAGPCAAPGRPGDRGGRLRRGDRAVRLGQIHAAAPAWAARLPPPPALPTAWPGHAHTAPPGAVRAAGAADRDRLPGIPPAGLPDSTGERAARGALQPDTAKHPAPSGDRRARRGRAGPPARRAPYHAVWRGVPAGRDRAGAGQPAKPAAV